MDCDGCFWAVSLRALSIGRPSPFSLSGDGPSESWLCTNHLNRAWCIRDNGAGNRSKDHAPHTTVTMRTQYDEVGVPIARFLHDHVLWNALHDFRRNDDGRCGGADQLAGSLHERWRVVPLLLGLLNVSRDTYE